MTHKAGERQPCGHQLKDQRPECIGCVLLRWVDFQGRNVRAELKTQAQRRKERADAERLISALGADVVVALEERDAAVGLHKHRAGEALLKLIRNEGLNCAACFRSGSHACRCLWGARDERFRRHPRA